MIFNAWVHFFVRDAIGDELGVLLDALLDASPIYTMKFAYVAARDTDLVQEGVDVVALAALAATADWLETRFPSGEYRWSDVHGTRFRSTRLGAEFAESTGFRPKAATAPSMFRPARSCRRASCSNASSRAAARSIGWWRASMKTAPRAPG